MTANRYIVIEGPLGSGKTALAGKLAESLGARLALEATKANPFLAGFLTDRDRYAFQTQMFFLLSRYKQQQQLVQLDLFQQNTVGDYLFDRDWIYARLNLGEEEFGLYEQIFNLLIERVPPPDLVIYLATRTDMLMRRLKERTEEDVWFTPEYVAEIADVYNRFFFHFYRAPLLVVNASEVDFLTDQENFQHLLKEINNHRRGVKYYVPLATRSPARTKPAKAKVETGPVPQPADAAELTSVEPDTDSDPDQAVFPEQSDQVIREEEPGEPPPAA